MKTGKNVEKTLFVSDLDGTLMTPEAVVSPRSKELLNEALALGASFTVATARTPATVDGILKGIHMNLPAIVMTGGALWDTKLRKYLDPVFFPPETAREILDIYKRKGMPVFLYALKDGIIQIFHIGDMNSVEDDFIRERAGSPFKTFHVGIEEVPEELFRSTLLFYGMQPDEIAKPVYDALKPMDINPMYYHDIFGEEIAIMEAFPKKTTKALAIQAMAKRIGATKIVVFGDNINDLSMFSIADEGIAVENAIPAVKERACKVIGANTEDAVAEYILQTVKNETAG